MENMERYETLKKALQFAEVAHQGQTDKAGKEYIRHPLTVALLLDDFDARIAGILHDTVEDSEGRVTLKMIREAFSEEIYEAVRQLTHDPSISYFDYLENMTSKIALQVKLADLTNNMDLSRIEHITEKDLERIERYKKATTIVTDKLKRAE